MNRPPDGPTGAEAAAEARAEAAATEARAEASAPQTGAAAAAEARPIEVELKYDVTDRSSLDPVLEAPDLAGFSGGAWREALVEDRYVDTRSRAVERAGYAARLRVRGDRTILGLKSLTPATGALHRREEIEAPVSEGLDPRSWPPSEARDLLLETIGDEPIQERFLVRQRRRVRLVSAPDGAAELSADEVEIEAQGHPLGQYFGLEVELRSGDEQILGRLAAALEATGGVVPSARSKFEIARDLAEPAPGPRRRPSRAHRDRTSATTEGAAGAHAAAPQRPAQEAVDRLLASVGKSPGVTADDAFAEAGRKVLRFHLARMLVAEPGTRSGEDPEDLHKMRVATRRMRAAWRVFGDGFRRGRVRRSVAGLRTLAALLGTVRDLDVLIDALEAYGARLEPAEHEELRPLVEAWRRERQRARTALVRYLDSAGYRRFVEEHIAFVETVGRDAIPGGPTDPRRVRDTAPSRLWTAYEGVRAYDGVLRWADLATLHQLRIAGKRLRYAIEFFREPLGPDAGMLVERVTGLQDHLGLLHDADVAAGLARSFLVERSALLRPASVDAVGRYLADREREAVRLRRTVGPVWRRVTSIEFRRALGRATAQL
ncbi:MAG: CHAD domain-containing protein [Candidatus Limnocylindrales bacterium]